MSTTLYRDSATSLRVDGTGGDSEAMGRLIQHVRPAPASVSFEIHDPRVLEYIAAVGLPIRGEAVGLGEDGPIPWALEPDRPIWGYIRGYDSTTRMLAVAPK